MSDILGENHDLSTINTQAALLDERELAKLYTREQIQAMRDDPARAREAKEAAVRRADLDVSTGKVAVMVAGEPPWHGLGVLVRDAQNSSEAIRLSGQNWTAEVWDAYAKPPGSDPLCAGIKAPLARHVVRTDTNQVLGTVGTRYTPFQNAHAFDFLDAIVGSGDAFYETAGALDGGRRVWMLCRIPKVLRASPADETIPYLLLANSHDGSSSLTIRPTTNRPVCGNTLNLALSRDGARAFRIRHSQSLKGKVELARTNLGVIHRRLEQYERQMQALVGIPVRDEEARALGERFFPTKVRPAAVVAGADGAALLDGILEGQSGHREVVGQLLEGHFAESERAAARNAKILEQVLANFQADEARGTAWGLYNGFSQHADHQAAFRGKTPEDKANSRLNSAWFGAGDELKQQVFQEVLKLAR